VRPRRDRVDPQRSPCSSVSPGWRKGGASIVLATSIDAAPGSSNRAARNPLRRSRSIRPRKVWNGPRMRWTSSRMTSLSSWPSGESSGSARFASSTPNSQSSYIDGRCSPFSSASAVLPTRRGPDGATAGAVSRRSAICQALRRFIILAGMEPCSVNAGIKPANPILARSLERPSARRPSLLGASTANSDGSKIAGTFRLGPATASFSRGHPALDIENPRRVGLCVLQRP